MLPSGWKNCAWLNALKSSPRNSSLKRSVKGVNLVNPISQLLMPGPQQIVRGAFPIVPGETVSSVKASGLKPALMSVQVEGSVPVPTAQVSLRGLIEWNGAATLG